jgi:hypothetical protein
MEENDALINIYAGTEASVLLLKARLEEIGISALMKNDLSDAWLGTAPSTVNLYIQESDFKEAGPIIREFILLVRD